MSENEYSAPPENPYAAPDSPTMSADEKATGGSEEQLLRAFVGSKAIYYLEKWAPLLADSGRGGFNWAAFLLSGLWLPYRKMYAVTMIFYGIILLESVLEELIFVHVLRQPEPPAALGRFVGLAASLICGTFGNGWYFFHARRVISDVCAGGLHDYAILDTISRRGGTSLIASAGCFILFVSVSISAFILLELCLPQ
jgi:hypothetical protein